MKGAEECDSQKSGDPPAASDESGLHEDLVCEEWGGCTLRKPAETLLPGETSARLSVPDPRVGA
jgi:hypothetical protein